MQDSKKEKKSTWLLAIALEVNELVPNDKIKDLIDHFSKKPLKNQIDLKDNLLNDVLKIKILKEGRQFYLHFLKIKRVTDQLVLKYKNKILEIYQRYKIRKKLKSIYFFDKRSQKKFLKIDLLALKNNFFKKLSLLKSKNSKKERIEIVKKNNFEFNLEPNDFFKRSISITKKHLFNSGISGVVGQSQWLSDLYDFFIELYLDYICRPLNFTKIRYPRIFPIETWIKTGHLQNRLHEVFLVSRALNEALEVEKTNLTGRDYWLKNRVDYQELRANTKIIAAMSYCQCDGAFAVWANSNYNSEVLYYNYGGPIWRSEGHGVHSIERLNQFTKIELIWICQTQERVIELRDTIAESIYNLLNDLELDARLLKVDNWADYGDDLICPTTLDLEVRLHKNKYLEIANSSDNSFLFCQNFKVKIKNKRAFSGCSGLGIDRTVFAFLIEHGDDPLKWPLYLSSLYSKWIESRANYRLIDPTKRCQTKN